MQFGLFLSHQRIHEPSAYTEPLMVEKRREAELADEVGFDMIWVPEHHLIHFMQAPNALMLAQHHGRDLSIRVGTMATLLPLRHPLITAAEVGLTASVLGDRFEFGVGRGAYEYEFVRLGVPFEDAPQRFEDILKFLEELWESENGAAAMSNGVYDFPKAAPWPRMPKREDLRVWWAAMTPPSILKAATAGYNVATWPFIRPMSALAPAVEAFHEGVRANGLQAKQEITVLRAAYVSHSEEEIEKRIDEALINHRINQRLHHFIQNADESGVVSPDPLDKEPSREEVRENLLFGTPDEVIAKIREYEEMGVDQIMTQFDFGPDHATIAESMRLFASEVIEPMRSGAK